MGEVRQRRAWRADNKSRSNKYRRISCRLLLVPCQISCWVTAAEADRLAAGQGTTKPHSFATTMRQICGRRLQKNRNGREPFWRPRILVESAVHESNLGKADAKDASRAIKGTRGVLLFGHTLT